VSITAHDLNRLPTLAQGQGSDLKVDVDGLRIWTSRVEEADGAPLPAIEVEVRYGREWRPSWTGQRLPAGTAAYRVAHMVLEVFDRDAAERAAADGEVADA
jgi:hypothetical protein